MAMVKLETKLGDVYIDPKKIVSKTKDLNGVFAYVMVNRDIIHSKTDVSA